MLPDIHSGPQAKAPNVFCNRIEISRHTLDLDDKRQAKSSPVVLKLQLASESPESLFTHTLNAPGSVIQKLWAGVGRGLRICLSSRLPGGAGGHTLRTTGPVPQPPDEAFADCNSQFHPIRTLCPPHTRLDHS